MVVGGAHGDRLLDMLLRLFDRLRAAGVDVAIVEVLDGAEALQHLDLGDRPLLRSALQATLVKRPEDVDVFRALFDECFPLTRLPAPHAGETGASDGAADGRLGRPGSGLATPGERPATADASDGTTYHTDLLEALLAALRKGDEDALRSVAAEAVASYSGIGEQRGGERYFLYRVLRALDLSNLLVAMMTRTRSEAPDATALALRHERDELARRIEDFRRMLATEIRHRLHHGKELRTGVGLLAPRRLEDLDVLNASTVELRRLREAVQPLARKLSHRVAERRRRHRRGRLDVKRTARRSLSFGGVPVEPAFRRRHPSKPQVVVLCDVSGSVAEFAHFTLMLLHALQAELSGLRSFIFVDGVADVTELVDRAEVNLDPRLLVTLPGVVAGDGHSDYREALSRFLDQHSASIKPSTTLIVMGDARTNYRPSGIEPFRELCRRARRVYWFNPEPRDDWGVDDSALDVYAETCAGVFEVRTLNQLAAAIDQIL
jgi:uncharacterized protein with von Willebrand factor type A (vWA) domain